MNQEQQIKALAELDGWTENLSAKPVHHDGIVWNDPHNECRSYDCQQGEFPAVWKVYLTSYDAIIPLIQRQDVPTITRISLKLSIAQNETAKAYAWLKATPAQLCEALLRATGKWIE